LGRRYEAFWEVQGTRPRPVTVAKNPEIARPPHNSGSFGKNGQVMAGADDLIQLIGRKVIVGKNIST
jgi:hypothetical protein